MKTLPNIPAATFRRLRVALVCDWYLPRVGGIERHLSQLAAHLAAAGHDVTVLTPTPGPAGPVDGLTIHRLPGQRLPGVGLLCSPFALHHLGLILRTGRFDVVHAHSSLISPTAYAALYHASAAGLPAVLTVHSIWGGFARSFRALDWLVGWTRWPVVFSAVSARVARDMQPLLPHDSVVVLSNALTPGDWTPAAPPPAPPVTLACVMRLAPRKRGAALLRMFQAARSQLPADFPVRLEIAGDGPERGQLIRLARRLGLGEAVRFHGALEPAGVKALFARSHVFVLPTTLEAFGLAALEARAAGLPIVAMRTGGVSEWLADGREGLLADDDEDFVRHLVRLTLDSDQREAIARHNHTTPVAFTWTRSVPAHEALYAQAITRESVHGGGVPSPRDRSPSQCTKYLRSE